MARSVAIKPLLLADKADYTFGLGGPDAKPERVAACHRAYLDLLERCAQETAEGSVLAVATFLSAGGATSIDFREDFDPSALITFTVAGQFPMLLASVQRFWARVHDPASAGAPVMQCLVCGRERPVLPRLQGKIKGIPGGQTAGTSIISANAPAFESYGLSASLVSPTCADCGEGFTRGANALLRDERSRISVGESIFIFWTRESLPFSIRDAVMNPAAESARDTVAALLSGRLAPHLDPTSFYGAMLTASGGRAVVRDWIDTTVGDVKESLRDWFGRQEIVDAYGDAAQPLGLYTLARATVREGGKDLPRPITQALLRAALTGTSLPSSLLFQAVRRARADQTVDRPKAALIKLVLVGPSREPRREELVRLMSEHPNPAYQCGRLLAVLESAQRAALPGVKAGIVDRFYGTASSAPGSVFPRLLRGVRPHLARLERDRRGAWIALEARLDEIHSQISLFPRVLTLEDQGLFALGYYHQRAADRAEARAAADRRKTAATRGNDAIDEEE